MLEGAGGSWRELEGAVPLHVSLAQSLLCSKHKALDFNVGPDFVTRVRGSTA
jgi:hypothetical protein